MEVSRAGKLWNSQVCIPATTGLHLHTFTLFTALQVTAEGRLGRLWPSPILKDITQQLRETLLNHNTHLSG